MFIPPNRLTSNTNNNTNPTSKVRLQSSHLWIEHKLAAKIFGDELNANVIYYPKTRSLMIAPKSNELFKKLHKAKQHMLKDRNLKGDKTIALHGLLIDHQINDTPRDLEYELQEALNILNVKL